MKAIVLILLAASTAAADPVEGEPPAARRPAEVFATQPMALVARGLTLSYERAVSPHTSAAVLGGVRGAARGDYSSRTWTLGAELRWWPLASPARPMRRLVVAAHASAGHTSLTDEVMDTDVGSAWTLTQRVDVGYRFVAWRHLTLTPTLGLVLREDVDRTGRLATTARPTLAIGFEVGWMR